MKDTRTIDQIEKEYVESGGGQCPWCGSDSIMGESTEVQSSNCVQEMQCNHCHKEWYDIYKLAGIDPIERGK